MNFVLTDHAKERMTERGISKALIESVLDNPTKILCDTDGRWLMKKLYRRKGKKRLLLVAIAVTEHTIKVITVIDTSKIKKYL